MTSIGDLWRLVAESPDDIGPRLVLADALLEQGDPRGELIALQCRGADAKVFVRETSIVEPGSERVSELIAENWPAWLGPLAQVIVRQGASYKNGMLTNAQITEAPLPPAEIIREHYELWVLDRVTPFSVRASTYATFLAALKHDPRFVAVAVPGVVRALRGMRERWAIRHIRFGGVGWWGRAGDEVGVIGSEFAALGELAPDLEVIEMPHTRNCGPELAAFAPRLPKMFPKLVRFRLEDTRGGWLGGAETALRVLPFVELA